MLFASEKEELLECALNIRSRPGNEVMVSVGHRWESVTLSEGNNNPDVKPEGFLDGGRGVSVGGCDWAFQNE